MSCQINITQDTLDMEDGKLELRIIRLKSKITNYQKMIKLGLIKSDDAEKVMDDLLDELNELLKQRN